MNGRVCTGIDDRVINGFRFISRTERVKVGFLFNSAANDFQLDQEFAVRTRGQQEAQAVHIKYPALGSRYSRMQSNSNSNTRRLTT
jgi:hypothetical protein